MALSVRTKRILEVAMADRVASAEMAAAIDSGSNPQAASVALIAVPTTDIPAAAAALSTADTYTDADVNAEINAAIDTVALVIEGRLDTLETKVNAIITALKAAGLMA